MCSLPIKHVLRCVIKTSQRQEQKTENEEGRKNRKRCSCGGSGDRIRSCRCRLGDISAVKTFFAFFTHVGKDSRRITTVKVDVAEHCGGTIVLFVVKNFCKRASKVLEGGATHICRIIWSFTSACYDCVVLVCEIFFARCFNKTRKTEDPYLGLESRFGKSSIRKDDLYLSLSEEELCLWLRDHQIHHLHIQIHKTFLTIFILPYDEHENRKKIKECKEIEEIYT